MMHVTREIPSHLSKCCFNCERRGGTDVPDCTGENRPTINSAKLDQIPSGCSSDEGYSYEEVILLLLLLKSWFHSFVEIERLSPWTLL